MKKNILAGFLGAIIAFVWSAVVHMNPLTGMMGLSMLNAKEDVVMAAVKENVAQPGLYYFPGMDRSKSCSKEEEAAWIAKFKAGPSGLLLVAPNIGEPMPPRMLIIEFVSTLGGALIAAFILATTVGSFARRVAVVMMLGLFGWYLPTAPCTRPSVWPNSWASVDARSKGVPICPENAPSVTTK